MNQSEWLHVTAHISRLWPNDPISPDTAVAWFPLLADLDVEDVRVAVQQLRLDPDVRWAPTPGQIRDGCTPDVGSWADAIPEIARRLSRSQTRADDGSFDLVAEYITTLGNLRTVSWDPSHPTVRAQLRDWWTAAVRTRASADRREVALGVAGRGELEGRR